MAGEKPRQIAARLLKLYAADTGYLDDLLERELASASLSQPDRGLVQELAYGVVRWQNTLDYLIARKSKPQKQKPEIEILLRLGLYQLFWLQRIPEHAAVHVTVELAKQHGFSAQARFINAVLRSYLRERETTVQLLHDLKNTDPALGYSHPRWLCQRWDKRWGADNLRKLLEWNNIPPITYARLNTLKADAPQLLARWQEEGVQFEPKQWDWVGPELIFELKEHPPLATLPSFRQGMFYIQDPSTLLAVVCLAPQPGEFVLDTCAAPGGKTTLIAQIMRNQGHIVAQDPHVVRRDLVRENCLRLGVINVEVAHPDHKLPPPFDVQFDRVLVDVPCSNTGVMRRRVELRWRIRDEEIERLRLTQFDLLKKAAAHLKPGGTLVYSTCSLEPEENSQLVREFLVKNRNFTLDLERSLTPFNDGVDGAYVARLKHA